MVRSLSSQITATNSSTPGSTVSSPRRWNYRRTSAYGSPTFKVSEPNARGNEPVNITGTKLSADKKTVTLTIEDLRPCHQQHIRFNISAADGSKISTEVMHTIHVVK